MREYTSPGEVPLPDGANLLHPVWHHAKQTPDRPLLAARDGAGFVDVTAAQFAARVHERARGLIGLGVQPGDRVVLMSGTRIEFTELQYAIMAAGAVAVPIYETDSAQQIEWVITDSGATVGFFENADLAAEHDKVAQTAALEHKLIVDDGALEELATRAEDVSPAQLERRENDIGPDTLATVIYTSGTTGRPKGVMTTHANLRWDAVQACSALSELFDPPARTLLFLPLAHSFAQLIQAGCLESGAQMGYATSPQHLTEEMPLFQPTFMLSVPRVWEKVYNAAVTAANEQGKGAIFRRAVEVAIAYSRQQQTGGISPAIRAQHLLFDRLVYRKLRARFGGQLRHAVSGASALGERLGHFYNGMGLTVLEGYGLTETAPAVTANRPDDFKIGTVGKPFPGCTVRVADDGELLIKGPNVTPGYWRNEEATRESYDEEGFFHSGDLGSLDDDGFVTITGRKKELIVTAGGKNVAPNVLEDRLRSHPLVSQAMVVGDDRPFVAALVTVDPEEFSRWAVEHDKTGKSVADLTEDPDLRAELQGAVDQANTAVSRAESIREFRILPHDFSIEDGELTPTLKVKRRVVSERYADAIDDIYGASEE